MTKSQPLLSVVVPTRDEEGNIQPPLECLRGALEGVGHEIPFVDDSDDATERTIAAASAVSPEIDLLHRDGAARAGG